jgi:hypothetical protein
MRSKRCCNGGCPFSTILSNTNSISVILYKRPCCKREFQSFLDILQKSIEKMVANNFSVLYDISKCDFNPAYMKPQEHLLKNAKICAIVVSDNVTRIFITQYIKHFKEVSGHVKIFTSRKEGLEWIRKISKSK